MWNISTALLSFKTSRETRDFCLWWLLSWLFCLFLIETTTVQCIIYMENDQTYYSTC